MIILNRCPIDIKNIKVVARCSYDNPSVISYKGKLYERKASSGRSVFKIGKYCIKLGFTKYTGKPEIDLYNHLDKADKKHFPKIYAYDFRRKIAIMDFLELKVGTAIAAAQEVIKRLTNKYDITDVVLNCGDNWGVCKKTGVVKIYDWEYNKFS